MIACALVTHDGQILQTFPVLSISGPHISDLKIIISTGYQLHLCIILSFHFYMKCKSVYTTSPIVCIWRLSEAAWKPTCTLLQFEACGLIVDTFIILICKNHVDSFVLKRQKSLFVFLSNTFTIISSNIILILYNYGKCSSLLTICVPCAYPERKYTTRWTCRIAHIRLISHSVR